MRVRTCVFVGDSNRVVVGWLGSKLGKHCEVWNSDFTKRNAVGDGITSFMTASCVAPRQGVVAVASEEKSVYLLNVKAVG